MRYIIVLLLFLPVLLFSQVGVMKAPFAVTDTIASVTTPDSVQVKLGDGPWKTLTESVNDTAWITADDKGAKTTVVFNLAAESWWTYSNSMTIRVFNTTVDTATSARVGIGALRGAITLFMRPDTTVGTGNTVYTKSTVEGN